MLKKINRSKERFIVATLVAIILITGSPLQGKASASTLDKINQAQKEKGQTEILFIDARPQKSASNL